MTQQTNLVETLRMNMKILSTRSTCSSGAHYYSGTQLLASVLDDQRTKLDFTC